MTERRSLASLLENFDCHGGQTAIVTPFDLRQVVTSYAEISRLARRVAGELERRQIGKGERVLLWGQNSAEWIAAFFGCVLRGVLAVPLDPGGSIGFAARVIRETSPKLALLDRDRAGFGLGETPVLLLERLRQELPSHEGAAVNTIVPDDALQIIFTSGTTGEPKGVVHTHGNVLASLAPIEREMQKYLKYERPFHPIRFLHTLPLSHVFGQFMGLWIPALLAAEVHFQERLVAEELVERIRVERISVLASVPRVLELLQEHLLAKDPELTERQERAGQLNAWQRWWEFRDIHSLFGFKFWAFICGGAALGPASEEFWNRLGFVVVQGYGMTETTALISLNHPFHAARGTIGQVLPGREVKLSEAGEVLVRGATIANSTWEDGGRQQQADEWLATGDLAEIDEAGNLRYKGRSKEVIVTSSGMNIHPQDLEAVLGGQAGVRAAAIVEQNGAAGPEALAVLVLEGGVRAEAVVAAANGELAEFQQIRRWLVWPEPDFPRTSTGKILKREIARRLASGEVDVGMLRQSESGDLALDSLARVELQAQMEQQYGLSLSDEAVQRAKTKADLEAVVRQAPREQRAPAGALSKKEEHIYPRWTLHATQQAIRTVFLELIAMPLVRFLGKPKVRRTKRPLPAGPLLIVCNHITSYDPSLVLLALPPRLRHRVAIAMSGEMLMDLRKGRNQGHWFVNLVAPVGYFLITLLFNVFPLPQLSGFRRSFRHAGRAMDRGYSVLVFPEGRRSDDGTPLGFKSGTGLLWKECHVPALTVHLSGLGELKAGSGKWFRSGSIGVEVGEVLTAGEDESPEQLTKRLEESVFGLIPAARE